MEEKQNEVFEYYKKLVKTHPDVELKGATMPYTSVNGHMFSQLNKSGIVGIRLAKEDWKQFMEKYNADPFESYGAVMREYVAVPDDLLKKTDELKAYFELSYNYACKLKPKPTKKKKQSIG